MVISMIAASGLTGLLGGRRDAQWFAALFTLSIPMALLQVTVPKNDVTAAMWVLLTAYLVVVALSQRLAGVERLALGLAVSLAMLTKGTALIFVTAVLAWFFLAQLVEGGMEILRRYAMVVGACLRCTERSVLVAQLADVRWAIWLKPADRFLRTTSR